MLLIILSKIKKIKVDKKDIIFIFDKYRRYATLLLRIKAKGKCRKEEEGNQKKHKRKL